MGKELPHVGVNLGFEVAERGFNVVHSHFKLDELVGFA